MSPEIKAAAHEYLKCILMRPLARLFWRHSCKKAIKLAYYMDAICK